jgi:hypothetical protein
MPLTKSELVALGLLRQAADAQPRRALLRAEYYDFIASYGDPYAALAADVPQGRSLNGLVANWFYIDQAKADYGLNVDRSSIIPSFCLVEQVIEFACV